MGTVQNIGDLEKSNLVKFTDYANFMEFSRHY
jgi:hypothetical protein